MSNYIFRFLLSLKLPDQKKIDKNKNIQINECNY